MIGVPFPRLNWGLVITTGVHSMLVATLVPTTIQEENNSCVASRAVQPPKHPVHADPGLTGTCKYTGGSTQP